MTTPHTQLNLDSVCDIMVNYDFTACQCQKIRKVFQVRAAEGDFALKPTQTEMKDIEFIQSVLLFLAARGFPVDPFIPAKDGRCFVTHGGNRFLVAPWFYGREADFEHLNDLMFGAKLLARFHRESRGFPLYSVPPERRLWGRWPEIFDSRIRQMETFYCLAKLGKADFDKLYYRFLPYFLNQAQNALTRLWSSPYPWVVANEQSLSYLCHHDFSDRNLLMSPYDCRLLDFDYCIADLRLHDLANLLLRLLRHDDWKSDRARFALLVYHRQYPLTEDDLQVLHAFLCWPQDYWQVGLQYYMERLSWPMERFMKTLNKKIEDEPLRQRFLGEFPLENGIKAFRVVKNRRKGDFALAGGMRS